MGIQINYRCVYFIYTTLLLPMYLYLYSLQGSVSETNFLLISNEQNFILRNLDQSFLGLVGSWI